jgi:hypothetical protein
MLDDGVPYRPLPARPLPITVNCTLVRFAGDGLSGREAHETESWPDRIMREAGEGGLLDCWVHGLVRC